MKWWKSSKFFIWSPSIPIVGYGAHEDGDEDDGDNDEDDGDNDEDDGGDNDGDNGDDDDDDDGR